MRRFAIGDIHGCSVALRRLDEALQFAEGDLVVTLGDYVDRGPDSRGVLDFLIDLSARAELVALRGNHEIIMQSARHDRSHIARWMASGGDATLESFGAVKFDDIPARYWDFIDATLPYFELERDIMVHANAEPSRPLEQQGDDWLHWIKFGAPLPHVSGKRMICGHTAQKSGVPLDLGHAICLDTWAYGDGWLTCLDIDSNRYWQANQRGALREGALASTTHS